MRVRAPSHFCFPVLPPGNNSTACGVVRNLYNLRGAVKNMITAVTAYSRECVCQNLAYLLGDEQKFFISVIDPLADNVFPDGHPRAITLRFDDVSPDMFESQERFVQICAEMEGYGRPYQLFSEAQAAEVVAFVARLHENPAEIVLHVHCTLGVSRSGAIATYVAQACELDMDEFAALNPEIQPNKMVLNALNRVSV